MPFDAEEIHKAVAASATFVVDVVALLVLEKLVADIVVAAEDARQVFVPFAEIVVVDGASAADKTADFAVGAVDTFVVAGVEAA